MNWQIARFAEKKSSRSAVMLFLIGLFSQTQISIGGKLGISEGIMLILSPFVFVKSMPVLKRDGVLIYFKLIVLWLVGAIFVDLYTHNYVQFALRGIAVPLTMFANSICIYAILRKNYDNLRWLLLGIAISSVVSIFVFQRGGAGEVAAEYGLEAGMERVVGYKLFWVMQLTTWLTLPISGWYQRVPKLYSFFALLFLAVFNLASGGRSAFLAASLSMVLVVCGGKTRSSLQFIKRHALTMIIVLGLLGVVAKITYKYAATHGYMGDAEAKKYEEASALGSGAMDLIIAGRAEFFIGLSAALDKPLLGHGSVALDDHGYLLDFIMKYGTIETYTRLEKIRRELGVRIIPSHSHIITYWMWHGVLALFFWLYTIFLGIKTLFSRMHVYPPWFGFLAIALPMFFWDVLFSPLGMRVNLAMLFVAMLLVAKIQRDQARQIL